MPLIPIGRPVEGAFRLAIPQREHGYHNFESMALHSQEEFNSFIEKVRQQPSWNEKEGFITGLTHSAIDFEHNTLMLVRSTAGSGSVQISFEEPAVVENEIVLPVIWQLPGAGTCDMNYQCAAMVIPKGIANNARIITKFVSLNSVRLVPPSTIDPVVLPLNSYPSK